MSDNMTRGVVMLPEWLFREIQNGRLTSKSYYVYTMMAMAAGETHQCRRSDLTLTRVGEKGYLQAIQELEALGAIYVERETGLPDVYFVAGYTVAEGGQGD